MATKKPVKKVVKKAVKKPVKSIAQEIKTKNPGSASPEEEENED